MLYSAPMQTKRPFIHRKANGQRSTPISRSIIVGLMVAATLSACTSMPPEQGASLSATPAQLSRLADAAINDGNMVSAAQAYQQLARISRSPAREDYLLQAASALIRGQYLPQARRILQALPPQLHREQDLQKRMLQARIELLEQRPLAALKHLPASDLALLNDPSQAVTWHKLRASAYEASSNYLEAARSRIQLEPLLADEAHYDNHLAIWQSLQKLSGAALQMHRTAPPPDVLSGWLELAFFAKSFSAVPSQLSVQVDKWRRDYPRHPAHSSLDRLITGIHFDSIGLPQKIALVLPLSGRLSAPATAVRDGFFAAYYGNEGPLAQKPQIRVYDTKSTVEDGLTAYQQAVADGADFIIGPLNKQLVEALAERGNPSVPTLALNYLATESHLSKNFYQFGLLPEDEARQVAERAWLDSHGRALALVPEGEWGDRMLAAFSQHWQQLGGELIASRSYDARKNDFADPIVELLAVDHSRQRHRDLQKLLGVKLEFEARRRNDIDFVYVAAFPRQARIIRPQLKFYYAADLPIYSTSHVYSGEADASQDRDMDDIVFSDMPWIFTNGAGTPYPWRNFVELWPATAESYKRLYALGIDAFNLSGRVQYLRRYQQEHINGMSGNLYMDERGRIHRQLLWGQFRRGMPRLIDAPPLHAPGA